MSIHRIAVAASAAVLAGLVTIGSASAMPVGGLNDAANATARVDKVAWVCGPYRCWWRPGPVWRPYGFYGPRPWGYRWHRPHRRWW